jgi:hypothetical protein
VGLEDLQLVGTTEEIISLKQPKRGHFDEGQRIDYKDTPTTRRYRDELRSINEWLATADIQFDADTYGSAGRCVETAVISLVHHGTVR